MIVLAFGMTLVLLAVGSFLRSAYWWGGGPRDRIAPYRVGSRARSPAAEGAAWSSRRSGVRPILVRPGRDRLVQRLRDAGLDEAQVEAFRMRQLAQCGAGVAAGFAIGTVALGSLALAAALAAVGGMVGYTRAPARLARDADDRRRRMRLELATIDQILAIQVRTGAGPVQAVMRVVERGHGVVVDELRAILVSVRTGRSEADAFRTAAEHTSESHAARTYRLFSLACEQGADLGVALRALSDDLRDVRRDELRRQATRRRAAMLVPTIAILAPIMLLFVIAPLPSIVLGGR